VKTKLTLKEYLIEAKKSDKKKGDKVFVDPDTQLPFPDATVSKLESEINKGAKDIDTVWDNANELTKFAFTELDVPIPQAFLSARWKQYKNLLQVAVTALTDTRGNKGKWRTTV
jgi:hypothetical protein